MHLRESVCKELCNVSLVRIRNPGVNQAKSQAMWKSSVETYVRGEDDTSVFVVVNAVVTEETSLLDLVESLGTYLMSTEVSIRCRGVRLLSEVLHRLPKNHLSTLEVTTLVQFYCARLKDHHSITPHSLYGLLALSSFTNLASGEEVEIVRAISKEVHVQSLLQVDRRSVYNILSTFLTTRLTELQKMGSDFVFAYIQIMDGEKDPRNLVIAFRCVPVIINNFPIDMHVEELFEVVACYFPIDFTPPANDPRGVTRDQLILPLRACLAATSKFAQFCLPLLIEKMTSDMESAKLDAYLTLAAAVPTYGAKELVEYIKSLWMYIRREVFQTFKVEIEEAALNCLTSLVRALSVTTATSQLNYVDELENFIDDICADCIRHLKETDLRMIKPSSHLLIATAKGSQTACSLVLKQFLTVLSEQFQREPQDLYRKKLLEVLARLLMTTGQLKGEGNGDGDAATFSQVLMEYKEGLVSLLLSTLIGDHVELRKVTIVCLVGLLRLNSVLTHTDVALVAQHFKGIVLDDPSQPVRKEAVAALQYMFQKENHIVQDIVLPPLLQAFQTSVECKGDGDSGRGSTQFFASTLTAICTHQNTLEKVVARLLDYLQSIDDVEEVDDVKMENMQSVVGSLLHLVEANTTNQPFLDFFLSKLVPQIFKLCIEASLKTTTNVCLQQEQPIKLLAQICQVVACALDMSKSQGLANSTVKIFQQGDLTDLGIQLGDRQPSFHPLKVTSSDRQTRLIALLAAVVCSVHGSTEVTGQADLLNSLQILSLQSEHQMSQVAAAKCYAGLLNKHPAGTKLDNCIDGVKTDALNIIQSKDSEHSLNRRKSALTLWLWLTKALVLRGHPAASDMTSSLICLFEEAPLGNMAANGFYIVLNESSEVMSKAMHANIKMMYRQRFFMQSLPQIIQGFNKSADFKQHYLTALSHLLHFLPKQVLISELPPLMPLMVRSLQCADQSLFLSTLETLFSLTHDAPDVISQHLEALLPQFMRLSTSSESMKVRIEALKCIGVLTILPYPKIHPHKNIVIKHLGCNLDDKKRLVRQEAVRAREEWFLLGHDKK